MEENKIIEEINNRCYTVYMHTSPSGKRYIGITSQKPERRWANGIGYKGNAHFWNAINLYGWNNFKHEVLFEELSKIEAEEKEIELIAYYNSTNQDRGYNIASGGNCNINNITKPVKQYTREGVFLQEYDSVKEASEITGINNRAISACCRNEDKTAGNFIWRFSCDEITEEYLIWCNSNDMGNNRLGVCQYSLNGVFIKKYDSILSAGVAVGGYPAYISACCQGNGKVAYGYIWRYEWEELTKEHLDWCNYRDNVNRRSVSQYLRDGTYVETYESMVEASLQTGVHQNAIAMCCRDEIKTAGDFLWRYAEDEITEEYIKWCNTQDTEFCHGGGDVFITQYTKDGIFVAAYPSMTEAQRVTGINRNSISLACKGIKEFADEYIWKCEKEVPIEYKKSWDNRKHVLQYSMDGIFIAEYNSAEEASLATGVKKHYVYRCCSGERDHSCGFIWRYASDIEDPYAPLFPSPPYQKQRNEVI